MTDRAATAAPLPRFALGEGAAAFDAAVEQARAEDWATRLFDRDTSLWSTDPRVQDAIADRLGWLDAPGHFAHMAGGSHPTLQAGESGVDRTGGSDPGHS